MRQPRDPYATPPAPRERGGPLLRFAIVAALLGAAAWAYVTYSQGPTLSEAKQQEQTLADASRAPAYAAPAGTASPPAAAPSTTTPAPAPRAAPATPSEPVPPPSTTTVPPSSGGG
jgi:hypothetical protein